MGAHGIHIKGWALAGLALAAALPAAAADFEDLVAAERAFAADASARNTRAAFLAALAPDSVMFAPHPVDARTLWEKREANGHRLEWAPALAEVSAGGDLGYTTGPWRFTPEKGEKPVAFGWFFSIWQKQPDGRWKLLVDHGIDAPESAFPETVTRRGSLGLGTPPGWPVGVPELREADRVPAGELNPRLVAADFLRLRTGAAPDARAEGQALPSTTTRVDQGLVVSAAGDLAATWGGGPDSPAWVRVWRRPTSADAPGAGWKLAVDFAVAAAPPRPADPAPEPQAVDAPPAAAPATP